MGVGGLVITILTFNVTNFIHWPNTYFIYTYIITNIQNVFRHQNKSIALCIFKLILNLHKSEREGTI